MHRNINQIQIISMENNSIRAKGTYRVIESKDYELIQEWNSIIAKENAKDENVWWVIFVPFLWAILLENERKMSDKRKAEKAIEHNANLRPVCMDSMRLWIRIAFDIFFFHAFNFEL